MNYKKFKEGDIRLFSVIRMDDEEKQLAGLLKWKSLHEFKLRKEAEYNRLMKKGVPKESLAQLRNIIKSTKETMDKI